jgi:hypothetical protein
MFFPRFGNNFKAGFSRVEVYGIFTSFAIAAEKIGNSIQPPKSLT